METDVKIIADSLAVMSKGNSRAEMSIHLHENGKKFWSICCTIVVFVSDWRYYFIESELDIMQMKL